MEVFCGKEIFTGGADKGLPSIDFLQEMRPPPSDKTRALPKD
jgi:hypothetical protein